MVCNSFPRKIGYNQFSCEEESQNYNYGIPNGIIKYTIYNMLYSTKNLIISWQFTNKEGNDISIDYIGCMNATAKSPSTMANEQTNGGLVSET